MVTTIKKKVLPTLQFCLFYPCSHEQLGLHGLRRKQLGIDLATSPLPPPSDDADMAITDYIL